jgi:hypothetical protein
MALLPKASLATPKEPLQDDYTARCTQVLPGRCCCRCMRRFTTRSALLRHLESKLTDCQVAIADGGVDVPRSASSALLNMAQRRTYDASRRCMGLAAVTKAVQQHWLMSTADARSFHLSALSTAHALMHLASHLLTDAARAAAGIDAAVSCSQQVSHVMDALEERLWALQLGPALLDPSQPAVATNSEPMHITAMLPLVMSGVSRRCLTCPDTHVMHSKWRML